MYTTSQEDLTAKYLDKAEKEFERWFRYDPLDCIFYIEKSRLVEPMSEKEAAVEYIERESKDWPATFDESGIRFRTIDILKNVMDAEDQDKLTKEFADELEGQLPFVQMIKELYRILAEDYAQPVFDYRGHNRYCKKIYNGILNQLNKSWKVMTLREDESFKKFYQAASYKEGPLESNKTWIKIAHHMAGHIEVPLNYTTEEGDPGSGYRTLADHFKTDLHGKDRKYYDGP